MRRLLIVIAVLLVALVVADRGLAALAGATLADRVRDAQGLQSRPDVNFEGFPFLTQALGGTYDKIVVRANDVSGPSGLTLDHLDVTLRRVHVPISQLVGGRVGSVAVDGVEATGRLGLGTLERAIARRLPGDNAKVTLRTISPGQVGLEATFHTPVGDVAANGTISVSIVAGQLSLELLPQSLVGLPTTLRDQVRDLVQTAIAAPRLSFGLQVVSVTTDAHGMTLKATAQHVVVSR